MSSVNHVQTVLEEIASRLGPGEGRPFADVDLLHGYLFRPEAGSWRLFRALDSGDYLEGSDAVVGAMRSFLTLNGDTLVWAQMGASLVKFHDGEQRPVVELADKSDWHPWG